MAISAAFSTCSGVPPKACASPAAAIAEAEPVDRAQLLRISGIGVVKADRFGTDVLRIVAEHSVKGAAPAGE